MAPPHWLRYSVYSFATYANQRVLYRQSVKALLSKVLLGEEGSPFSEACLQPGLQNAHAQMLKSQGYRAWVENCRNARGCFSTGDSKRSDGL